MSSSVTEGSTHDSKLLVHIAENGHSFEFRFDEDTPVELVMQYIERFSGINCNDQLILCSGRKLEPQRLLSAYKLPSPDREVFIYNKARLQQNSPPPPPEQVETAEVVDPPSSASLHASHPLDEALDPALKALPSYERQFRYHYQQGHSIYVTTQEKYKTCGKLLREQKVQERALEVAKSNVDQYYKVIHQNYSEFMKCYTLQHRAHSGLLMNFGKDFEKLRSIKLHPALQTATWKSLVDFVKEDNVRKAVENCNNSRRQFEKKVSDFKQMFADVKRKVEELFAFRASVCTRNLEVTVKEHQRFISEQRSIMQSLSKDVDTVKKLVDDCLSSKMSSSLRPHDAVSALGPMYDVHDKNHLPKMEQCACSISNLLEFCNDKKNEMNLFVHMYMQRVTYISYIIKDIKLQFPVFREAMECQEDHFADLNLVHRIGPAYRACLAEVVRRKNKMRLYMGMAGQLAERLATEREVEVRRREEFLKTHSVYIPRDILATMGLYDTPSQCDVNISPFDSHLLDIDISDLKLYAPDYLEVLKSEKQASWKAGSASTSNDISYSPEAESIGVDSPGKDDSGEWLKDSELLEIAGTSKLEVENAKLKAELASAIAVICSIGPDVEFELLDDSKIGGILKNSAEKTAEALRLKDDYEQHLQSLLKAKQMSCESYEKRIQELEQRLSNQYLQGQKLSASKDQFEFTQSDANIEDCKPGISGGASTHLPYLSTSGPMDEISCISNSLEVKLASLTRLPSKGREGVDENMMDSSGTINTQLDSSMLEPHHEELQASEDDGKDKVVRQMGMSLTHSFTAESRAEPLSTVPTDTAVGLKANDDLVVKLQNELMEKSSQQSETESKLKAALEEVAVLTRELETQQKLLEESQMNCAHLENWLHEAREEAQTHLCAADRRASEYNVLRASAAKMRGLLERLRSCVCAPGGVAAFADSLHALSQSLANSKNESDDDGTAEFRKCIQVLADKVGFLARHREELLERYPKLEAANEQLRKELEEKKDLVSTLFKKHQLEKQANKEKISFNRLDLHEIAAFVRNSNGHYEAINRNCSNCYLSAESVALFTDHFQTQPTYIVGQIVHIERQTVKPCPHASPTAEQSKVGQVDSLTSDDETLAMNVGSSSTTKPYGLPVGCEYFVVTVAMLPDTTIHSSPTS